MSELQRIHAAIASFDPHASGPAGDEAWLVLDKLVEDLARVAPTDADSVPILLEVFERFPRHDGHGVFWSLLHYVENVPGYERELVAALVRAPTEFTVTMLHRWMNSGATTFEGSDLRDLYNSAEARAPSITHEV